MRGIGISCDSGQIDGRPARLHAELARARDAGFDCYELAITATNMVRAGKLIEAELNRVEEVLAAHPLSYTLHLPNSLRLTDQTGMAESTLCACIEIAQRLGAHTLVYHSAQIALRPADQDTEPLPDLAGLRELRRRESQALRKMAGQAAERGLVIALENRDPHRWELAALARHGKGPADLLTYHAGMSLDVLAEQVAEIASPGLGICLDVGHAHLACPYWPEPDYQGAIRRVAPWVRHVHYHDNFGLIDDIAESLAERLIFGEADNHLPPGWGSIPLPQVLQILREAGYGGWLIGELRGRYADHWPEAAATMRRQWAEVGEAGGLRTH